MINGGALGESGEQRRYKRVAFERPFEARLMAIDGTWRPPNHLIRCYATKMRQPIATTLHQMVANMKNSMPRLTCSATVARQKRKAKRVVFR